MIGQLLFLFFISEVYSLKFTTIPDEMGDSNNLIHSNVYLKDNPRECLEGCTTAGGSTDSSNAAMLVNLEVVPPKKLCLCFRYPGPGKSLLNYALGHLYRKHGANVSVTMVPTVLEDVVVFWPLSKVSSALVGNEGGR